MVAIGRCLLVGLGILAWGAAAARAEDLERGKSGSAIFAADCAGCHRGAQGLAYGMSRSGLMDLLRQHYTTGPDPANQVATYLLSVVGNGRRPKDKALTEPTAAGLAGEQGKQRRARTEEPVSDPAPQRPPADIKGSEAAPPEQGSPGEERSQPGPGGSKHRQQAAQPPEPGLPGRSKKPGQPATASRVPVAEPARRAPPIAGRPTEPVAVRPPAAIPARPSESPMARPPEPPTVQPPEPAAVRQPGPAGEAKGAESVTQAAGPKAEVSPQPAPAAPIEAPKPAPWQASGDQSAFSAPSP